MLITNKVLSETKRKLENMQISNEKFNLCPLCQKNPPREGIDVLNFRNGGLCTECALCASCGSREKSPFSRRGGILRCAECVLEYDQSERERLETITRFKQAGFYLVHELATSDTLNESQKKIATDYLSNPFGNLFITGSSGCGKTWTSVAIGKKLIERGYSIKFISLPWMFAMLRDWISRESGDFSLTNHVNQLLKHDYLILDDLGANRATDWAIETLYLIIDQWEANNKPGLIITSNLNLDEVSKMFSDRIASRISRAAHVIYLHGEDRRYRSKG